MATATTNRLDCSPTSQCSLISYYGLYTCSFYTFHTVACPTRGSRQFEITFNPKGSGSPRPTKITPDNRPLLASLSCSTRSQCTALDPTRAEMTFAPRAVGHRRTFYLCHGSAQLDAGICATHSECVAVTNTGDEINFDPRTGRSRT